MGHAVLSASLSEVALARLDHLIAEIAHVRDRQADLLLEHLQSARVYLLGAMPDEYEFSLVAAKDLAAELTDADMQKLVMQEVTGLLDQMAAAQPASHITPPGPRHDPRAIEEPDKSELYRFFHGF